MRRIIYIYLIILISFGKSLSEEFDVPGNYKNQCKLISTKDMSYQDKKMNKIISRRNVYAVSQNKITKKLARNCIRHFIKDLYKSNELISAVSVYLYENKKQIGNDRFTIAKGTFAPAGGWENASDFNEI